MANGELASFSTPTSDGLAQVFDTTGLQQAMERKEVRADAKAEAQRKAAAAAQKESLDRRDKYIDKLEEFQIGALNFKFKDFLTDDISGVEKFFKDNEKTLTSGNPDIDIQLKFQKMYNNTMNNISSATEATKKFEEISGLLGSDNEYDTEDNHSLYDSLIDGSVKPKDIEDFRRATNINNIKGFTRKFDISKARDRVLKGLGASTSADIEDSMNNQGFIKKTQSKEYKIEKLQQTVTSDFNEYPEEYKKQYKLDNGGVSADSDQDVIDFYSSQFYELSKSDSESIVADSSSNSKSKSKGVEGDSSTFSIFRRDEDGNVIEGQTIDYEGRKSFTPSTPKKLEVNLRGKVLDTESGEMVQLGEGGLTTILPIESAVYDILGDKELNGNVIPTDDNLKSYINKIKKQNPDMVGSKRFITATHLERLEGEESEIEGYDQMTPEAQSNAVIARLIAGKIETKGFKKRSLLIPYEYGKNQFEAAFNYKADDKDVIAESLKSNSTGSDKRKKVSGVSEDKDLGFRNNNPGNLRGTGKSTGFRKFDTLDEGFKAMVADLNIKLSGKSRAGTFDTISDLIGAYAPSNENDTEAYASSVAKYLGVDVDFNLKNLDAESLAEAMIRVESPNSYNKLFVDKNKKPKQVKKFGVFDSAELEEKSWVDNHWKQLSQHLKKYVDTEKEFNNQTYEQAVRNYHRQGKLTKKILKGLRYKYQK